MDNLRARIELALRAFDESMHFLEKAIDEDGLHTVRVAACADRAAAWAGILTGLHHVPRSERGL